MKILLVDDHALIREALRGVLFELDNNVVVIEAADGRQARGLIAEHPDLTLILLDLNLPDGNGYELDLRKYSISVAQTPKRQFTIPSPTILPLQYPGLGTTAHHRTQTELPSCLGPWSAR